MFKYTKKLHELHNYLLFLPERMKIEKVEKLVANLHDKTEYVIHWRNLKEALNHELFLKKVKGMTKCNSNVDILLKNHILIWTQILEEKWKWFWRRFF